MWEQRRLGPGLGQKGQSILCCGRKHSKEGSVCGYISRWEGDRESMHGAPKVFSVTGGKREGGLPW